MINIFQMDLARLDKGSPVLVAFEQEISYFKKLMNSTKKSGDETDRRYVLSIWESKSNFVFL